MSSENSYKPDIPPPWEKARAKRLRDERVALLTMVPATLVLMASAVTGAAELVQGILSENDLSFEQGAGLLLLTVVGCGLLNSFGKEKFPD